MKQYLIAMIMAVLTLPTMLANTSEVQNPKADDKAVVVAGMHVSPC